MKEWVISLAVAVLSVSVFSLLLPNGKTSPFIKKIFSVLLIFIILQPLSYLKNNDLVFNDFNFDNSVFVQEEYLDYITRKKLDNYKQNCLNILNENGVSNSNVEIEYSVNKNYVFSINCIKINLKNSVINSDKSHIDIIDKVKEDICAYTKLEKEKVIVYEK